MRSWLVGLAALSSLVAGAGVAAQPAVPAPIPDTIPIALLIDANSGQVLHERNADRRFMPASITKTMTAFLAFELLDDGKIDPRQIYSVRPETFKEWHRKGSTMFLPSDAHPSVAELLTGIMTVSANDGAVVLAEGAAGSVAAWTAQMNAKAREIGMTNSHFNTPNGWPDEGKTFVTAHDLARLASAMLRRHPARYRSFIGHQGYAYGGIAQSNHDPLIGKVPGADGIKTGFTNEAGYGYLGTVSQGGRRLILVVAGAESGRARNAAAKDYVEWGFARFEQRKLFGKGADVAKASVQNGDSREVTLRPLEPIYLTFPKGTDPNIRMQVSYDGPLRAPIQSGQRVAVLQLEVDGMPTSRIPLVADHNVQRATVFDRVMNGFLGWFL